jgi:hypothetical protein
MVKRTSARRSVQRYRSRMRRAGFRLVQMWVPDTRARGFPVECKRQSRAAAKETATENEVLSWIEAQHDTEGWTP